MTLRSMPFSAVSIVLSSVATTAFWMATLMVARIADSTAALASEAPTVVQHLSVQAGRRRYTIQLWG